MTEAEAQQVVKKVDTATDKLARTVRLLKFLAFINLVISSALIIQIQTRTDKLDNVDAAQVRIEESVDKLRTLADDISNVTPEEQARSAATVAAVTIVPQIKALLCEEYPDNSNCTAP